MKITAIVRVLLALQCVFTGFASASSNDTEITFTAQDIQAIIDKAPKSKALIDGLILVSLEDGPVIKLGQSPNRFGVSARLAIQVAGAKPVSVKIGGSGSVMYSEPKKAFFLDAPLIETIDAPFIPKALEAVVRTAITNQLVKRFSTSPIYALRENGPMKERREWRLLKSIQIRKNEVVATYIGGTGGFEDFVQSMADPEDDDHFKNWTWNGGPFDPKGFDVNSTNIRISKLR